MLQVAGHKSQVTGHNSKVASHMSQVTGEGSQSLRLTLDNGLTEVEDFATQFIIFF